MTGRASRTITLVALAAVAILALAATTATAHDRGGGPGVRLGGASTSALVTDAAKRLNITRAKLVDAIEDSARSRIDDAVADGDIPRDDAADLKEDVADNLHAALSLSRTRTVASNLGITTTRLNDAFRAARKAAILSGIADALEDERIDKERADELRDELEDAEVPGYKGGFGGGPGGFGGPGRHGPGLGGGHLGR